MFKRKKVLFDSDVWMGMSGQDLQKIKDYQSRLIITNEYIFFDSAVNLFETVYTLKEIKKDPKRIPIVLKKVIDIAGKNMFPDTKTIVDREINKYFGRRTDDERLKCVNQGYRMIRDKLINQAGWVDSDEFKKIFAGAYYSVIDGWRNAVNKMQEGVRNDGFPKEVNQKNRNDLLDKILNEDKLKHGLFKAFKDRLKISDSDYLTLSINNGWLKIESLKCFYIWHRAIVRRYLLEGRDPFAEKNHGDFIDLEFSYYIPYADVFVSNNTKDLKRVKEQCEKMEELDISNRLKTFSEFMEEIN